MVFLPAGPINTAMLLRFGKRINLIPVYEATIVHQISDGGAAGGLLEERQMGKGGTDGNNELSLETGRTGADTFTFNIITFRNILQPIFKFAKDIFA